MRIVELYADSQGQPEYFRTVAEAEDAILHGRWRNTIRAYISLLEYDVDEANLIDFLNGKVKHLQNQENPTPPAPRSG